MLLCCPLCHKNRLAKAYYLYPTRDYIEEIMHKAYCRECDKDIILLISFKADGSCKRHKISNIESFKERRVIRSKVHEPSVKGNWYLEYWDKGKKRCYSNFSSLPVQLKCWDEDLL